MSRGWGSAPLSASEGFLWNGTVTWIAFQVIKSGLEAKPTDTGIPNVKNSSLFFNQ